MNSRDKGKRGELELVHYLEDFDIQAERGQQRAGSPDSPDVKIHSKFLHIEVKRVEKLNIWEAMAQAVRDAGQKLIPSVWYRRNRADWWVTMPAGQLIPILKRAGIL